MQAFEVRDDEIERRLDAYARARLSPDPQAIARVRSRVMREARLQFETARIAAQLAPAVAVVRHRSMTRRLAMPLLAASLWLGVTVGSISAAQAGGPLYATRIWIETATLPASGAPRASAELDRLETRLSEAGAAAARGDFGAVQAALDAYAQIADAAVSSANGDPALTELVSNALDKHRAVLAAVAATLEERGSDTAAAAVEASLQRAILHNQAVVEGLGAGRGAGGASNGAGSGTSGGSSNGSGNGSGTGATGGGNASGGSSGSGSTSGSGSGAGGAGGTGGEKPDRTPRPTPDPQPPANPAPDHTPHGPSE